MLRKFIRDAEASFSLNAGSRELQRLYQPALMKWGFSNFYYVRIKRSGAMVFLTTNVTCALDYWEAGLPVRTGFEQVGPAVQSYAVPFADVLNNDVTSFFQAQGCYDGFGFVNRYYDTVQFASFLRSKPAERPNDFLLHHQQELSCWLKSFEWNCRGLIHESEQQNLRLPDAYFAQEQPAFYPRRSLELRHKNILAKISFRMLDCLHLCGRGFSQSQIGNLLGLSPRTVETHLQSVRNSLGLHSREELVSFAYQDPTVQNYCPRLVG